MSAAWKTVRVFISSTFRDMQAERDGLVKRVCRPFASGWKLPRPTVEVVFLLLPGLDDVREVLLLMVEKLLVFEPFHEAGIFVFVGSGARSFACVARGIPAAASA